MADGKRPARLAVIDELGRARTLAGAADAFAAFGSGQAPVFLGLGPNPECAAALLLPGTKAAYVECEAFAAQMPPAWAEAVPAGWERLPPEALDERRIRASRFFLYRQNPRLFPSFWGPIWAGIQLALLPGRTVEGRQPGCILPTPPRGLLEAEISRAATALGRPVLAIDPDHALPAVRQILAQGRPELFLCVNGAGLDDHGLVYELLAAAGVPVAIWFVDNPFHVLGRFQAAFWRQAHLFVTDDWFLAPLIDHGAAHVHHLPLAAAGHFLQANPADAPPGLGGRAVFVGRSAFPGKDKFFAGCRLPSGLAGEARAMLEAGGRPDFSWWVERLGLTRLWPGKAARQAGYGAEEAGASFRAACLGAAGEAAGLTVFGDEGWEALLPGADRRGVLDYYGRLPAVYAAAGVNLNITSLLLPHGLTQRHFDAWAAGGVLLTDATPGLDLFPAELTTPVTFTRPSAMAGPLARLLADTGLRADLVREWRALLMREHTYEHRLARVLEWTEAGQTP